MDRLIFKDKNIYKISKQIQKIFPDKVCIGVVLGSGWGTVCDYIEDKIVIPYSGINKMPKCSVQGHNGNFVLGRIGNKNIIIAQGRFHLYEGKSFNEVLTPIKVMYALGIEKLILTNAAGGLNETYKKGDLMVFKDHINFTFKNPLISVNPTHEYPVFCDMTNVYDAELRKIICKTGNELGLNLHKGVYTQLLGPSYETPAEIKAFQKLGADAVGMSTVIEAIYAKYLNLKIAAISSITNLGAGLEGAILNHKYVLSESKKNEKMNSRLILSVLKQI